MSGRLTVKQAAEFLGVHQVTVRRWIGQGKIEALKIGGRLFIDSASLGLKQADRSAEIQLSLGEQLQRGSGVIGVWGVGYIGFSTLVYFATAGVSGVGYDISRARVNQVNRGEVDIPGLERWLNVPIKNLISNELIKATHSVNELFESQVLVHFICIPTEKNGKPWFGPLGEVIRELARKMKKPPSLSRPLIVIESTLSPGASDQIVLKTMADNGLELGRDFLLAVAPRRDWFSDQAMTLKNIDRVFGAADVESARQTRSVLSLVCDKLHQASSYRAAEMVKSVENAYRHMDITLANQLTMAYPEVNMREVLRLVGTKWNASTFYPSFGTGGYCIPISSRYVVEGSPRSEVLTLLHETIKTDSQMPQLVARSILKHQVQSVGILGLSYKGNLKVHQQSPTIKISRTLKKAGVRVRVNDPYFSPGEIRSLTGCGTFSFPEEVDRFEALVLVAAHAVYQTPRVRALLEKGDRCRVIYDNVGAWKNLTYFNKYGIDYYVPGDGYWLK